MALIYRTGECSEHAGLITGSDIKTHPSACSLVGQEQRPRRREVIALHHESGHFAGVGPQINPNIHAREWLDKALQSKTFYPAQHRIALLFQALA